jgi:uncharacterized membrane protein
MHPSPNPPIPIQIIAIFAVIAALQVFDLLTHDDVLTAVNTIVICGAYIGWWFWRRRYS